MTTTHAFDTYTLRIYGGIEGRMPYSSATTAPPS
jgi:hypothetical protein